VTPGNALAGIDPAAYDPIGLWFTTGVWPELAPGRFSLACHGHAAAAEPAAAHHRPAGPS
jgi:hypothetical protein